MAARRAQVHIRCSLLQT